MCNGIDSEKKLEKAEKVLTVSLKVVVGNERIVSPAVKYIGETNDGYTISVEVMGVDWDHAFKIASNDAEPITPVQYGFMTSKKRFVDVFEARYIVENSRLAPLEYSDFPGLTVEDWITGLAHIPLRDLKED